MNTKNNQRFQETDQKIRQVFLRLLSEKDLPHITVQDICNGSNINRSTFYAHYTDIYDLLSKMEVSIRLDLFDSFLNTDASAENFLSPEYFEIIISHVGQHQLFYRAYLAGLGNSTIEEGLASIREYVFKPYFYKLGIASEARLMYHSTFFISGFLAVLKQWLNNGCLESSHEVALILWNSIAHVPHE